MECILIGFISKQDDIVIQLNSIKQLIKEMKLNESLSSALIYCLNTIDDAIIDIEQELDTIKYRLQYNNTLVIGSTFRSYKIS